MLITQPLQIRETGKWRVVETSDEDSLHQIEKCPCADGHDTKEAAFQCYKLRQEPRISDAEKAKRYRRKLEDLAKAAGELLLELPLLSLSEKQKPLAMALADEAYLIRQQLDIEKEFKERFVDVKR